MKTLQTFIVRTSTKSISSILKADSGIRRVLYRFRLYKKEVIVKYASGSNDDLHFDETIQPGKNSKHLDLKGGKRVIKEITIYYKAEKKGNRHRSNRKAVAFFRIYNLPIKKFVIFACSKLLKATIMFNSIGNIFRLTSFGESHGKGIGGVIDGFPSGITIDEAFVQQELNRRRPGQSAITTARKEEDKVEFLSGIFEGKSTGCPIGFIVWNQNQHSDDYNNLKEVFRPSHADYTYMVKYGIRDHRGGGRSSARETISRVVAGALAKLALRQLGISITAYTSQVGPIKLEGNYTDYDLSTIEENSVRCPDPEKAKEMTDLIYQIKGAGDTIGGVLTCVIKGCPIGLGQPVYGKLQAALAAAMLSINAAKAFEYGDGFKGLKQKGSEQNDVFYNNHGRIETRTNHSGGIQGGISNGQDIFFRVAFKPVATVLMEQETVNIDGIDTTMKARGRHDPCVLPRAVPIVESMAAMTILDYYLLDKTTQLFS